MFEVIEKETGKRRTVYAVQGDRFTVGMEGGFIVRDMAFYTPIPKDSTDEAAEVTPCVFSLTRHSNNDLETLLAGITSGEIPVDLGSTISTRLLDGTEVDLVVTAQDEKTIRLESRDCLGINTSARELDSYFAKIYNLLPTALKKRIVEVERIHLDSDGDKYTERCKLFAPAQSEMFPSDECYGDEGLYEQMEWYKDVHNRVRADRKGGDSHWYWTSSPSSGNSSYFCSVNNNGTADYYSASGANGLAPFGCIISKN